MQREPNTQYVLSLSYGKDSIAAIEACKQLGWPLDRIVHAEVWATDDIPADLPPMVEFKQYADRIIKERYGITVEHICAMRKVPVVNASGGAERERERVQTTESITHDGLLTKCDFTNLLLSKEAEQLQGQDGLEDSLTEKALGVSGTLKQQPLTEYEKLTYEKLFYHIPKRKKKSSNFAGGGWTTQRVPGCVQTMVRDVSQNQTAGTDLEMERLPGFRQLRTGAAERSSGMQCVCPPRMEQIAGFPHTGMRSGGQGWCHELKRVNQRLRGSLTQYRDTARSSNSERCQKQTECFRRSPRTRGKK